MTGRYVKQSCGTRNIALLKSPVPVRPAATRRPPVATQHRPETEITALINDRQRAHRQDTPQNALARALITQIFLAAALGGNLALENTIGTMTRAMLRRTYRGAVARPGLRLDKVQVGRRRETGEADHSGRICTWSISNVSQLMKAYGVGYHRFLGIHTISFSIMGRYLDMCLGRLR